MAWMFFLFLIDALRLLTTTTTMMITRVTTPISHRLRDTRRLAYCLAGLITSDYLEIKWSSLLSGTANPAPRPTVTSPNKLNFLECRGNYSVTSTDTKSVHWPLMGGPLHLVQRWGDWAGPQPAQAPPRSTKFYSPPIMASVPITVLLCNGPLLCGFNVPIKG